MLSQWAARCTALRPSGEPLAARPRIARNEP